MRAILRAATVVLFLGVIALGGSGGGFIAQFLLAGPRGVLPVFWWLAVVGLVILGLGWVPPLRRWSGTSDVLGAALLILAILELGRAIEGLRLVLLTGAPCMIAALLLTWRVLRETPPA